jgi:hypothetical protein
MRKATWFISGGAAVAKRTSATGKIFVPKEDDELIPVEGEDNVFRVRRRDPAAVKRARALVEAEVEFCRKQFEASGDGYFLLSAIDLCIRCGYWTTPPFIQQYCTRFIRWASYQEPTFDQAFSIKPRKRFEEAKKRHRLMPLVVKRAAELHKAGKTLDGALWETIGEELGVSGTQASKLYYAKASRPWRLILGLPVRKTSTK